MDPNSPYVALLREQLGTLLLIVVFVIVYVRCGGMLANRFFWQKFVEWRRGLPGRYRMWRDPVLRRKAEVAGLYDTMVSRVSYATARKNLVAGLLGDERGQDGIVDDAQEGLRPRTMRAVADWYAEERDAFSSYLAGLSDADIDIIAEHISAVTQDGKVPWQEIAGFLREERALLASRPFKAFRHTARLCVFIGQRLDESPAPRDG